MVSAYPYLKDDLQPFSFSPWHEIPVVLDGTQQIHLFICPCFAGAFGKHLFGFPVINRPFLAAPFFIDTFHRIRHIVLYSIFV
jgi:hypothetical protein